MPFQVTFLLGVFLIEFHSPFGPLFLKNMLESMLFGKRYGFLAVPHELVAKFSAEMGVRTEIGVVVCPVEAILPDAVVCCLQEEPYGMIEISGKDVKPCGLLIDPYESSCKLKADVPSVLLLLPTAFGDLREERFDEIQFDRRYDIKPCVLLVCDVFGPCDQLILLFHHNIND